MNLKYNVVQKTYRIYYKGKSGETKQRTIKSESIHKATHKVTDEFEILKVCEVVDGKEIEQEQRITHKR